MEKRIYVLLFFLSTIQLLSGQTDINKQLPGKPVKQKKGLTEIEITMIGLGINRVYPKKQFSMGWGIGLNYLNWVLSSNNNKFKDISGWDKHIDSDYLRIKMINRFHLSKYNDLDVNPTITFSFSQSRVNYYSSIGIDFNFYIIKYRRIKISSSLQIKKSLTSSDYILSANPLILVILIN